MDKLVQGGLAQKTGAVSANTPLSLDYVYCAALTMMSISIRTMLQDHVPSGVWDAFWRERCRSFMKPAKGYRANGLLLVD